MGPPTLAAADAAVAFPATAPGAAMGARPAAELLDAQQGCLARLRRGDLAGGLAQAAALLPALQQAQQPVAHRELLYASALASSDLGRFDTALSCAHELLAQARTSGQAAHKLSASFALAAALERMGDPWQAQRVLLDALQGPGQLAPPYERMVASNGLAVTAIGLFHRLRGVSTAEALAELLQDAHAHAQRALRCLGELRDPVYEVTIQGNLGEILVHMGRTEEAGPMLQQALQMARARGLRAHAWRILCSLGEWHLARGRADESEQALQALLEEAGAQLPAGTELRARQALYRACRALQRHEQALTQLELAERLERLRSTTQLRAQSQLFVTRSEHEQARTEALSERARADAYRERAEQDPLTGLANRRALARRLDEQLAQARASGGPLSLVVLDLDHFKSINDSLGHAVGDQVLVRLAQLLRENTRPGDLLARTGGEEFVLLLPGLALAQAQELCERLRSRLAEQPWPVGPAGMKVTASLGLAQAPPYDAEELLRQADSAMYGAKRAGRNRLQTWTQD